MTYCSISTYLIETLFALVTRVRHLLVVDSLMLLQRTELSKLFFAVGAVVRLFTGVNSHVLLVRFLAGEGFSTGRLCALK